jgi:hypothetical protein
LVHYTRRTLRQLEWKKDHEGPTKVGEQLSKSINALLKETELAISNSFDENISNLTRFVNDQDVAVSFALADNRFILGTKLYERCVRFHTLMLRWYQAILDKDVPVMRSAHGRVEENNIDLVDALSRRRIYPFLLAIIVVVAAAVVAIKYLARL